MRVFLFRLFRLGFARAGYDRRSAIGGWRHLWWRLWWELREPPRKLTALEVAHAQRLAEPVEYRAPRGRVMHWAPDYTGLPICGVELTEDGYWTRELRATTCTECLRVGPPIELKHRLNTR